MRITYRTLSKLIDKMNDEQKDSDLTIILCDDYDDFPEAYAAKLSIVNNDYDILPSKHPYICISQFIDGKSPESRDDVLNIAKEIGLT